MKRLLYVLKFSSYESLGKRITAMRQRAKPKPDIMVMKI